MENKECKHQYEPIKKIVPEPYAKYISSSAGYNSGMLNKEEIYVFCSKCGDSKRVDIDTKNDS